MREIFFEEIELIDGGVNWGQVAAGAAIIGVGVAIVATAGLATVPIAIAGAATAGELITAAAGITAAAAGGVAIGTAK